MNIFREPTTLRRRVLVNTGALASANLWRIVVSFLVQLLVARALGLEALGQYTVAMAYLNISQVLCEMGLPLWMVRELAQAPHLRTLYFRRGVLLQMTAALLLWAGLVGLVMLLPYPLVTRTALFWVGASLPLFAITSACATQFQAAERMELAFVVEIVINLLILLLSAWQLWQQQSVADLLLVVVVAQGIGMMLALGLLFTSRLLAPAPLVDAPLSGTPLSESLPWRKLLSGAMPFFGLSLTDVLLQRLDILLLSLFADARLLGTYSAAYNLVRVAIKLLQSVWRGAYPTLARLYVATPERASRVATKLLYWGLALCLLGALLTGVLATPIVRFIYGVTEGTGGSAVDAEVARALAWLIWQAPLFLLEFYATTWLLVVGRARTALVITLAHLLLLALLLPLGAALAGSMGAAWGTVAAQALGAALALWQVRKLPDRTRSV
ncbi:MAG: oligosaccharide flippase family protein [Caldilineaceae bacterium]|nr:oligosaccharide flippase family protein [Caldilineaceae bacterium]